MARKQKPGLIRRGVDAVKRFLGFGKGAVGARGKGGKGGGGGG